MAAQPSFPANPVTCFARIQNSDGTNLVTVLTAGGSGTIIEKLSIATDETVSRDIQFWVTISSVDYWLFTVQATTLAGTTSSNPSLDVLGNANAMFWKYDAHGNKVLFLPNGAVLKAKAAATLTSAKIVYISGMASDY